MLTRHPKEDVYEAFELANMTFRGGDKLETKSSEASAYNWHFKAA